MFGISITKLASYVTAFVLIGGTAVSMNSAHVGQTEFDKYVENNSAHVAQEDFDKYIEQRAESDERAYILSLKQDIRDITIALQSNPDDFFLLNELQAMIDELCLIRPNDRLCQEI